MSIFPKGNSLPKEWLPGNAFLSPLAGKDHNNDFSAASVTFEPTARTNGIHVISIFCLIGGS